MAVESSAKFDTKVSYVESNDAKCPMCVRDHPLYACSDFKRLPPGKRLDLAKGKHLCFSCLKPARHSSRFCPAALKYPGRERQDSPAIPAVE